MIKYILIAIIFFCTTTVNAQKPGKIRFDTTDLGIKIEYLGDVPKTITGLRNAGKPKRDLFWQEERLDTIRGIVKTLDNKGVEKAKGDTAFGVFSIQHMFIDSARKNKPDTLLVKTRTVLRRVMMDSTHTKFTKQIVFTPIP